MSMPARRIARPGIASGAASAHGEQPRGRPANRGQFYSRGLREPAAGSRRARKQAWRQRLRTPLAPRAFSDYPIRASTATLHRAWHLLCAAAEMRGIAVQASSVGELDGATGSYLPEERLVRIAALGDAGAEVVTLAHEMGHVYDPWFDIRGSSIRAQRIARDLERFDFLRPRCELVAQQVALKCCRSLGIDAEAWSEAYLLDWSGATPWGRRNVERRTRRAWANLSAALAAASRAA